MFDASTGRTFPPAGAKVSVPLIEPSVNLMWIRLSVSAVEAVPIRHALRWNGVQQHLWIVQGGLYQQFGDFGISCHSTTGSTALESLNIHCPPPFL